MRLNGKKIAKLSSTISINAAILFVFVFIAGSAISKVKTGNWFFSKKDRGKLLRPDKCKEFSCAGFADFNDIKRAKTSPTHEPVYCIVSNPIFGYYNICTKGNLGLSRETSKLKPKTTYRALLVGGSQANINTLILEDELNQYLRESHNNTYLKAEVFGAAIGGGKQPMQLQAANALLAMGFEFDSIININGWNEIMLATLENQRAGIPPIYPRSHVDRLVLEQRNLSSEFSVMSCTSLDSVLGWHTAYNLWSYSCIKNQRQRLAESQNYGLIRAKLKLDNTAATQKEINNASLRAWQVSAQSLDGLSSKHGLDYIEVIQPTKSTDPSHSACYNQNFADIYNLPAPELIPNIDNTLLDLRSMSSTNDIFTDCVHLNDRGSQMLAQKITRNLRISK